MKGRLPLLVVSCLGWLAFTVEPGRAWGDAAGEYEVKTKPKLTVMLSLGSHNISWPFQILTPAHPLVKLGIEFPLCRTSFGYVPCRFNAGGFINKDFDLHGLFLNVESGFRAESNLGLFAELTASVGYLHTFEGRQTYFRDEEGRWREATDWGRPNFLGGFGLGLGYGLERFNIPVQQYSQYQWFIQAVYVKHDIPLMAHGMWDFGLAYHLK